MDTDSPYRRPSTPQEPSPELLALSEAGRRRRAEHQRASETALTEREQGRLEACVQTALWTRILCWAGGALFVYLCILAATIVGAWFGALCGLVGIAGFWWVLRQIRKRTSNRALSWPDDLPFPLVGWQRWLVDWEDIHGEHLWITFAKPAPRQLVADSLAAVMPDAAPQWLDDRQVGLKLRGVLGFKSAYGSGWVPDVAKIQRLAKQVLIPLHGSQAVEQVEFSRQDRDARISQQHKDLTARGQALAVNQDGLPPAEQLAALETLWYQALDLPLEKWDRDRLDEALASAVRRAILFAGQKGDRERAQLLREAGATWGIDLSDSSLKFEQRLLEAGEPI